MDNLPKRNHGIYKVIEGFNEDNPLGFEDYEYTNCIAYEMAIRNSELQKLIKEITREHNESDNLVELEKKLKYYFFDVDIIKHIEYSFDKYFKDYYEEFYNYCEYVQAATVLHQKEFSSEELEIIKNNTKKIFNFFYNNLHRFRFYFDDYIDEEYIHNNSKEMECLYYGNKDTKIINEKKEKAIITKNDFMRFKRPRLIIPKNKDRSIELKINPNLPKEELIAYISKIKDEYHKDHTIIKSPLELQGVVIEDSDNKAPKKSKVADMFFIYDYHKVRKKDKLSDIDIWSEIDTELSNYHDSIKENYYSEKTYKTIKKEMKSFIDNLGYKELITGTTYKG